jgi:hypothetical protein
MTGGAATVTRCGLAENFSVLKTFVQFAAGVALLVLAVGAALVFIDAHHLLVHANQTLVNLDAESLSLHADIAAEVAHVDAIVSSAQAASDQMRLAAAEQRAYWQKTSADSDKTVKALRLTVDRAALLLKHTDEQLNGSLLPDLNHQIALTGESAQSAFASAGHAGDALTFQINDMEPIFANLRDGTAQLSLASAHADQILLDGEKTADYYEKRLTTPASFAKRVGMGLLDVGSKLGNIMAGFVK